MQDLEQSGRVAVQGLRVETRYIQGGGGAGPALLPATQTSLTCVPTTAALALLACAQPPLLPKRVGPSAAEEHLRCPSPWPPTDGTAPADMAARMAQRDQQDARHKRKLRGQREASVLDPCRLKLDFKLVAAGGEGEGAR